MIKKVVCVVSLFFMTGCFGGYSPESTFYTLQSIENVMPLSQTTLSLGVDLPELPEYADRPQIVSVSSVNSELNIDETPCCCEYACGKWRNIFVPAVCTRFPRCFGQSVRAIVLYCRYRHRYAGLCGRSKNIRCKSPVIADYRTSYVRSA